MLVIPATWEARQEECNCEARMDNLSKSYFKIKTKEKGSWK
jgi:hypothetical protein